MLTEDKKIDDIIINGDDCSDDGLQRFLTVTGRRGWQSDKTHRSSVETSDQARQAAGALAAERWISRALAELYSRWVTNQQVRKG